MLTATWLSILFFSAIGTKALPASLPTLRAAVAAPACGPLTVTAAPATISFNAANPDSPAVAGNAMASITWQSGGQPHLPWNLSIQSDGVNFLNCPAIPVSAIQVSCSRAAVTGGGGSGVCAATAPLASSPRVVASGDQSVPNVSYQVNLNFTLSDSWKYAAEMNPPCTLSITYTVNFQ
jgi:hypothetical protein